MIDFFGWRGRRIRTVWRIEKNGRSSMLVGTAHFAPYSFEKPLRRLLDRAEVVVFEGPLDDDSMRRVAEYGRRGDGTPSVYHAISGEAKEELNEHLAAVLDECPGNSSHLDFLRDPKPDHLQAMMSGVRPWLAFFSVWSTLLNWKHSMDREAYHLALNMRKEIRYLETIDDQLVALDGVPFDRIVHFFNDFRRWQEYRQRYLKIFLSGDMDRFAHMLSGFPTRCDSILTDRDPIFFNGLEKVFATASTAAFVGNAHIMGLHKLFKDAGYQVTQETI